MNHPERPHAGFCVSFPHLDNADPMPANRRMRGLLWAKSSARTRWAMWGGAGLLGLVMQVSLAFAQEAPAAPAKPAAPSGAAPAATTSPDVDRPWAAGVAETEQARALEIYVAGNTEFAESRFAQALAKYREAIEHWDHPAIRFNMAVCLIHLGLPIEARDHLEKSLAYGMPALGADAHAQAATYRKLLDAQLTHLTISCTEPGAQVSLDGKPLFTGPGTATRYLLPGEHQVVATKPGLQADLQTLTLSAGVPAKIELRPAIARMSSPQLVRRWPTWKPWAVLGSGGALAGIGALAYVAAKRDFDAYDRGVASRCPAGCTAAMLTEYGLADEKSAGERMQVVAFSHFVAGGGAVVAGVVGLILNQPRVRREPGPPPLRLVPAADGATIMLAWDL